MDQPASRTAPDAAPSGHLKEGLTMIDVVSIGVGSAVGVSIFSIMAPAAKVAGTGMLAALALASIPMIIFAVVYAFMGSAVPRSGASFEWPARFIHPFVGFMVAWLRVVGNTGALTVLTLVLVSYASRAVTLPQKPTMFVLLLAFYLANLFGVRIAGGVERVLVLFKLIAFAVFVVLGLSYVQPGNFQPLLGPGWGAMFASLPLLVSLYMGIESAVEVGEEIRNVRAVIAKGLASAVILTIVVYVAVSSVALRVLGAGALGTSVNAIYLTFTRFLFAMGRDGVLPAPLARVHPRWGTPHVAVTTVFVLAIAGLLLPSSLVFLFLAVSIPTMLKYLSNCWSAWRLVDHYPDLRARAHFALSRGAVKAWSIAGILCGLVLIAAGLGADWRPYAVLGVWFVIGCLYWVARGQRMSQAMRTLQTESAS